MLQGLVKIHNISGFSVIQQTLTSTCCMHCSRSPEQSTAKMPVLTAKVLKWPLQLSLICPPPIPLPCHQLFSPRPCHLFRPPSCSSKSLIGGFISSIFCWESPLLLFLSFIPTQLHRFLGHTLSCPLAMKPSLTEHFPCQASRALLYS